jgi:hypothetical protein
MIKSKRFGWAGYVERKGGRGLHIGFWWESQKEKDHQEVLDVGGWTILKLLLES